MTNSEKCTAETMRQLLRNRFNDHRQYAVAEEVGECTGYNRRRLDMIVCNCFESKSYSLEGIEIKVSRSDLRKELKDSSKHNVFFDDLDYYSLAAPAEIIDKEIIPKHWGIYAARFKDGQWSLRCDRKPLSLHDEGVKAISRPFFASLIRQIACSSPASQALKAEYERGYEAGRNEVRRETDWQLRVAERDKERLKALEYLERNIFVYDMDAAKEIYAEFCEFRKLNLWRIDRELDDLSEIITEARNSLMPIIKRCDNRPKRRRGRSAND